MSAREDHLRDLKVAAIELSVLMAIVARVTRVDLERHLPAEIGSAVQYGVLRMLRARPSTLTELSRMLALEPASLTPVIDALERHALIERGRDPRDRRRAPITITAKAEALLDGFSEFEGGHVLLRGLDALGAERAGAFLGAMRELLQHMTDDPALPERVAHGLRLQITTDAGRDARNTGVRRTTPKE